jgi:hypothetical protein
MEKHEKSLKWLGIGSVEVVLRSRTREVAVAAGRGIAEVRGAG